MFPKALFLSSCFFWIFQKKYFYYRGSLKSSNVPYFLAFGTTPKKGFHKEESRCAILVQMCQIWRYIVIQKWFCLYCIDRYKSRVTTFYINCLNANVLFRVCISWAFVWLQSLPSTAPFPPNFISQLTFKSVRNVLQVRRNFACACTQCVEIFFKTGKKFASLKCWFLRF